MWEAQMNYAKIHGWHGGRHDDHKKEMEDMLADANKRYEEQAESAEETRRRDLEAKHNAVEYALKSWEGGKEHAAVDQVFHLWAHLASAQASKARGRQAVHASLLKFMEGEARAGMQLCFLNWGSDAAHAKKQREADEAVR